MRKIKISMSFFDKYFVFSKIYCYFCNCNLHFANGELKHIDKDKQVRNLSSAQEAYKPCLLE